MNAPAFTPGPWRIENCSCGHPSCNRKQLANVGVFYQGTGFEPADAHLIAAAPELYEVVERISFDPRIRGSNSLTEQMALAALAKARGEQVPA